MAGAPQRAIGKESTASSAVRRRALLAPAARALGLAAGVAGLATSAAPRRAKGAAPPVVSSDIDPTSLHAKLLSRVTYHPTPADFAEIDSRGYSAYLEWQLNPAAISDTACDTRLTAYPTLNFTPAQMYTLQPPNDPTEPNRPNILVCLSELTEATIIRATYSRRQLFERVVEMWNDHFHTNVLDQDQVFLKPLLDRDAIRANALGRFRDLLVAVARSPSMMQYLDNIASTKVSPNQNFSRELLELHTITPESGYSQLDVEEVARCFTGWTRWSESPANGTLVGTFRFDAAIHDTGPKQVLGVDFPAGRGEQDGLDVLDLLTSHPATAWNIASKIARWFLGERVHPTIVTAIATTYMNTDGDIKAMIRTALDPRHLADAPRRFKRPFHLFASSLRATGVNVASLSPARAQIDLMGQPLFAWDPPDGYPDSAEFWGRLLMPRWNFAILLSSVANNYSGSFAGCSIDDLVFFAGCTTPEACTDRIAERLFPLGLDDPQRLTIRNFMNPFNRDNRREALAIAMCSEAFQWY